jgi:regulator of nucleoside diphosphate kinase
MRNHRIIVAQADMERLSHLISDLERGPFRDRQQLDSLDQVLQTADVVLSGEFPADVIRMGSKFILLDLNTRKRNRYELVWPESADISNGRISVLAPLGTAVLGHATGDVIEPRAPGGWRRLRVERTLYSGRKKLRQIRSTQTDNRGANWDHSKESAA